MRFAKSDHRFPRPYTRVLVDRRPPGIRPDHNPCVEVLGLVCVTRLSTIYLFRLRDHGGPFAGAGFPRRSSKAPGRPFSAVRPVVPWPPVRQPPRRGDGLMLNLAPKGVRRAAPVACFFGSWAFPCRSSRSTWLNSPWYRTPDPVNQRRLRVRRHVTFAGQKPGRPPPVIHTRGRGIVTG